MDALKSWLPGHRLGHSRHPLGVHLPLGMWTLSFLFDLGNRLFAQENWLVQAAFYTLTLGLFTGIVAALFGVSDRVALCADQPGRKLVHPHLLTNLIVMALYLISGWLRLGALAASQVPFAPWAVSFIALSVLCVSGYLGGRPVYDEGVGVGHRRRQAELPDTALSAPQPRPPGEFLPVRYTQPRNQSETVRLELNG